MVDHTTAVNTVLTPWRSGAGRITSTMTTGEGPCMSQSMFDDRLSEFRQWQSSPWGRLRYRIVAANLSRHLPDRPLSVLDIGGGNGLDAIELAARGHHVAIVDISEESLAEARSTAAERGLTPRISTHLGDVAAIGRDFEANGVDAVMLHNVLQYVSDPSGVFEAMASPLRADGVVSVLAPNAHADPLLSAVRTLDLDEALRLLDSSARYSAAYQAGTRACFPENVETDLAAAGLQVIARYGVRSVCDYITSESQKADPEFYTKLERLELALADRVPYIYTARFFHIIAAPAALREGVPERR
ncbi:methyltransferase domain-containing protein [Nocardia abscessus]|uniref:methyltransferase domain-containing protein n=1 Tax=Nocardia abscessus TaxID=120957 RepID=UPI0018948272|nr:methyltransferase domain-containing protein [Nocardia abscessus]MBF6339798.1 methyltransferase domain-containing protein [Nocardia abscessus]